MNSKLRGRCTTKNRLTNRDDEVAYLWWTVHGGTTIITSHASTPVLIGNGMVYKLKAFPVRMEMYSKFRTRPQWWSQEKIWVCFRSGLVRVWLNSTIANHCRLDWPINMFLAKHILDTPIGMSVYFARNRLIGQFNHRPFFKRQIYCRLDKMLTKSRPKSKHREGLVWAPSKGQFDIGTLKIPNII